MDFLLTVSRTRYVVALVSLLGAATATAAASPLERAAAGKMLGVSVDRSASSGFARTIRADRRLPLPTGTSSTRAEDRARSFLGLNRSALLDDASSLELETVSVDERDGVGMSHVRLQQTLNGLRIRGAEAFVHMNDAGVVVATSTLLPTLQSIPTAPTLASADAVAIAREIVFKKYAAKGGFYSDPVLEVFDAGLLNDEPNHPRLAWFVKVNDWRLNEYIWVDATTGELLASINQVAEALNRQILDGRNTTASAPVLARAEGGAASNVVDVNSVYDFLGAYYNYYLGSFGRDSFDANGARITGIARACVANEPCPMVNAFWDGVRASFGAGFAVEDVVAHELSHAVVQYTADLIYQNESGAMNESYADIFGETIQLTDPKHITLPAERWIVGEELDIAGVVTRGTGFRNMMNPTLFRDPASTKDANYSCNANVDNGGVHTNSGVGNKAYALMTDGGTFNGYTIRGIGLAKAAAVEYRALSVYLGTASTYLDNYNALVSACSDLVGSAGVSVDDCAQVKAAALSVQMTTKPCTTAVAPAPPPRAPAPTPAASGFCPAGRFPVVAFSDDFENTASGNWVNTTAVGRTAWTGATAPVSLYATGHAQAGVYSLHGLGGTAASDSAVELKTGVVIPPGGILRFDADYNFETGFDAGVIEYSTDAGSTWRDAGPLIVAGRNYDGGVGPSPNNALAGRLAFTGTTGGYRTTHVNLTSLAGGTVRFRFRLATDNGVASMGWWIDNVSMFRCAESGAVVVKPVDTSVVTAAGKSASIKVSLSVAPAQPVQVPVSISRAGMATVSPASLTFTAANWNVAQTVTVTGKSTSAGSYAVNFGPTTSSDAAFNAVPAVAVDVTHQGSTNTNTAAASGSGSKSSSAGAFDPWMLILLAALCFIPRRNVGVQ